MGRVAIALGGVVVAVIATMAYLRRTSCQPMASRRCQARALRSSSVRKAVAKADDRVVAGAGDQPARPAASPPAPASDAGGTRSARHAARARGPCGAVCAAGAGARDDSATAGPDAGPGHRGREQDWCLWLKPRKEGQPAPDTSGYGGLAHGDDGQGQGQQAQLAIAHQMDVPDARLRADLTLQREHRSGLAGHPTRSRFSSSPWQGPISGACRAFR